MVSKTVSALGTIALSACVTACFSIFCELLYTQIEAVANNKTAAAAAQRCCQNGRLTTLKGCSTTSSTTVKTGVSVGFPVPISATRASILLFKLATATDGSDNNIKPSTASLHIGQVAK